jgi:DNA-binding CsgD family transcriptional regulator
MSASAYSTPTHAPRTVRTAVETVLAARGDAEKLGALIDQSRVPMVLIDDRRRCLDANSPARLLFRLSLVEMRASRVDDLVPPDGLPAMMVAWRRVLEAGSVTGTRELPGPGGARLRVVYYGLANVLPGRHVGVFAPAGWSEDDLGLGDDEGAGGPPALLTPREREILQLAADGFSGSGTAERLVLSPATVKTHFSNIYEKLGVPGRAAAVAKAMRLGYIV